MTPICSTTVSKNGSFYNFNRPHGGLWGKTPYQRLRPTEDQEPGVKGETSVAQLVEDLNLLA
jgi:hypothetical protein